MTVFEAKPEPGGVLRYGVVSNRFDMNFLKHEMDDIKSLGVQFQCNSAVSGQAGAEKLLQDGFDAVFLAPGLWAAASIKSTDRDIDGLFSSVDYLAALRDGRLDDVGKLLGEEGRLRYSLAPSVATPKILAVDAAARRAGRDRGRAGPG